MNLRKFQKPSQKPKVIHTYNLLEFGKYCEELSWNHRTTSFHRSETSGIAERAVRGIKERHQPYYCNLDGMISGSYILWNAVDICEMTKTSWQTGNLKKWTKIWGILLGHALFAGRIWEEDILTDEIENLEKLDISHAKEFLITKKDGEFVLLVADGSAILSARDYEFQEPTLRRESTVQRRISRRLRRVSTWRLRRWRRRSGIMLVHSKILHLMSS